MIEIRKFEEKESVKDYVLIDAFPGIGLVGPMAGSYMIEKLGMEYMGYIASELFPPIAAVHNRKPMFPARLYKYQKSKLIVAISEFAIPSNVVYQLAEEILSFSRKEGIRSIVSLGGMPSSRPSDDVFITSTSEETMKKALGSGIKPIEDGIVAGVNAVLLSLSPAFNINSTSILVEVNPFVMDPKYAEIAIKGLSKIIDIKIDLGDLEKEAKEVEAKVRDMLKKSKESHEHYDKAVNATGPSMYA
ncbi:MAG: PAC2 family protein [Candidatus Micrarchaeaceae archaeon]